MTQTVSILTFFFAFAAAHDYFVLRDQMEVLEIWWNLAEIARHFFLGSFGSFFSNQSVLLLESFHFKGFGLSLFVAPSNGVLDFKENWG